MYIGEIYIVVVINVFTVLFISVNQLNKNEMSEQS